MIRKKNKPVILLMMVTVVISLVSGCGAIGDGDVTDQATERSEGWTEESHSNDVDPDYDIVFPQETVNRITISIDPADWEAMQANMVDLYGERGSQQQAQLPGLGGVRPWQRVLPRDVDGNAGSVNITPRNLPGFNGLLPGSGNITPGNIVPGEGDLPGINAGGIPGWADMTSENPDWFPATIEFNGQTWTNVGFRYKGNSSLTSAWRSNSEKIPFKLDFDEFEDDYPEIDNQRFFGFKQLSFSNAFSDSTYMHDTIASDILQNAGLVAAETAYYEVIVDYGEGEIDLGLYVAIEVVDDTVIENYFGDDSGNIYEGDGRGVSLADGTAVMIEGSFQKENNKNDADWSDIKELFSILHSGTRISDPAAWREELESVFDVDTFLKWLAIAGIIQHWDTYGSMTHNFYLYNNPETGQLTWISWDHNQVLAGAGMAVNRDRPLIGARGSGQTTLSRDEVTAQWPLIRYLLDDPVYYSRYLELMEETLNGAFDPDAVTKECEELAELISPYIGSSEYDDFTAAVESLISQVYQRYQVAEDFLEGIQ